MQEIRIGVQMPEKSSPRSTKYPFNRMAVGDSVCFNAYVDHAKIRRAAHCYGQYKGWKFTTRIVDHELVIWRTK